MSARNTILLKGEIERFYDEGVAAGNILPGQLIMQNGDAEYVVHGTAGANTERLVAVEDDFRGMNVEGDLPSDGVVAGGEGVGYVDNDKVRFHVCQPGDWMQMILEAEQVADEDDFLTSNGNGNLKVASGSDAKLFRAMEALDLTGGDDTFIKVRVV